MQISELHQYLDEAPWLFIENKGSGSKTKTDFKGIHKIKIFNIISSTDAFVWRQ